MTLRDYRFQSPTRQLLAAALALGAVLAARTTLAAPPAPAKVARATPAAASSTPAVGTPVIAAEQDLLAGLAPYLPKAPVTGELKLAGSSAMNQLALLWADGLRHVHPESKVTVEMYESGKVLDQLAGGAMQVGLMSRPLTEEELKAGNVIAIPTAKDVLGVIVHPSNPLSRLSLEQGVALLADPASTSLPGAAEWGKLGLEGEWSKTPIHLYGRESGSGAWGYLVNRFLGAGASSRKQIECDSYAQLCEKVAADRGGVGYVSLALAPPKAGKVLALMTTAGELVPAPKPNEPIDPRYPLVRELYVVMKWKQGEQLSPLAQELLRYVLSRSGQEDAVKCGLIPMRRDEVLAARDQLGWTGVR